MFIKKDDVILRLQTLGYNIDEGDNVALVYVINGTEQYIKNFCNISEIPDELYYAAVDMAAGKMLKTKFSTGTDTCEGIDFDADGIKSITEGDISVTYSDGGGSLSRYEKLIDSLLSRKSELIKYRKLRW